MTLFQNVITFDEHNYNGLVFLAVSSEGLELHEQALAAYKKAIESDPNQMLAWQVEYYIIN